MSTLPKIDAKTAEAFMATVPWDKRFHIGLLSRKAAVTKIPVQSVDELLRIAVNVPPFMMAESLANWVRLVLGDAVLADAIVDVGKDIPPFEQGRACVPLLELRRAQATAVLGRETRDFAN
jgi:hypothetical protein